MQCYKSYKPYKGFFGLMEMAWNESDKMTAALESCEGLASMHGTQLIQSLHPHLLT